MRRNYISPEFTKEYVYGTYNMTEQSTFFGAKMLEIEDRISIATENFVWFQRKNGEQLDLETEKTMESSVYSSSDSKKKYHKLDIDVSQSSFKKENSTAWILTVNVHDALVEYLFSVLKRNRTFEGITTKMTPDNSVDQALRSYVINNVVDRYRLSGLDLYLSYVELVSNKTFKFKNSWEQDIAIDSNLFNKLQYTLDSKNETLTARFEQQKPATTYNYKYFFNLNFEKI